MKTNSVITTFEERVKSIGVNYDKYKDDPRGYLTLTTTQQGEIICCSIEDEEHRFLEILWRKE